MKILLVLALAVAGCAAPQHVNYARAGSPPAPEPPFDRQLDRPVMPEPPMAEPEPAPRP